MNGKKMWPHTILSAPDPDSASPLDWFLSKKCGHPLSIQLQIQIPPSPWTLIYQTSKACSFDRIKTLISRILAYSHAPGLAFLLPEISNALSSC